MQLKHLADLKHEFKKFTGFMIPDSISDPSSKSVSYLSDSNLCLPIEDSSSPIVSAFSGILSNKKLIKAWPPLISTVCSCITSEVITGEALHRIVKTMENSANDLDYDSALKIIQFATSSVGSRFLEIPIFQAILSLVLAFCSSKDASIFTAAFAAFRQILNSFIVFAKSSNDTLTPVNKRDIDDIFCLSCEATITFDNSLSRIIYLILRDLSRMCNGENAVWIHNHEISTNTAFGIFENIIKSHSDLLISSPHFLQLIEVSMIAAEKHDGPLSFSVTCMDNFLEAMPQQCASHFNYFLNNMKPKTNQWLKSLKFFRVFIFKKDNIILRFYQNCDRNIKLIYKLIQKLLEFSDFLVNQENIELSLNPIGLKQIESPSLNIEKFKCSAPVEIAIYFVQACLNSDPSIKTLVSAIWKDLLVIISVSLTSVVDHSCYVLMQNLHLLIDLSYNLKLEEARGAIIAAFCNVLMSTHAEVRKNAYQTITFAIQSTPGAFVGHWYKILSTLAEFQWEPNSFDFTTSLNDEALEELTLALLSIHNNGKMARAWSLTQFSQVLLANIQKYHILWPHINNKFLKLFGKENAYEPAVKSLESIISKGFLSENELSLCEFIYHIINEAPISRFSILEIIRNMLSQQGLIINKGWEYTLKSISPQYLTDDQNLIDSGFQCLQVICSELMFNLEEHIKQSIISLIIDYAHQKTDNNVSLSSFNLLWNALPLAKNSDMWKLIFRLTLEIINDERSDISLCAVKTFFSIITSNASAIPTDVFDFLSKDCFNQIIDIYVKDAEFLKESRESTHQLFFQEIAHCSRSLWSRLSGNQDFVDKLWPKIIDQHLNFMLHCKNRDVLISSFQFYEEAFQCFELPHNTIIQMFDTLDKFSDCLIEREQVTSSLFGAFGRLFLITLPTQKSHITNEYLERWIQLIENLILKVNSGPYLPPTTHKSLDALLNILPLTLKQEEMIYQLLVSLVLNKMNNIRLADVALDHIYDLLTNWKACGEMLPKLFIMSSDLFPIKQAQSILMFFVESFINGKMTLNNSTEAHEDININVNIDDEMIEAVVGALINLGKQNDELSLKTGYAIIKLFLRISDESKEKFISSQSKSFELMEKLWSDYFDPNSSQYNESSAILCTKYVAKNIGDSLISCVNDLELNSRLIFLKNIKSNPAAFGKKTGQTGHINCLIPIFADLVLHPNEEVRKSLREIFILLQEE